MTPTNVRSVHLAALLLLGLAACEGTPKASTLAYADPVSGDYQLRRNPDLSTATHLVLELLGPPATGSGVSVTLRADSASAAWAKVTASDPAGTWVQNGTRFQLGASPQIIRATVTGDVLKATVAQKGTGSPVSLGGPLLRVALDMTPGLASGARVALTAEPGKSYVLDGTGAITPITISVGSISSR
jgi:hypothetical protein